MMRGLDYGYGMGSGGWIGGLIMSFFGLLVLAGIVLIIVWAVRSSAGHHQAGGDRPMQSGPVGHDEAVAIAKRRYANGEIDRAQYEEILRGLGS